jgi:hypothetical protein
MTINISEPSPIIPSSGSNSVGSAMFMLREIGGPGPVKSAIFRAAKLTGLPHVRVWNIFYGKARRIEEHEFQQIQQAWGSADERARRDLIELKSKIARLEARLAMADTRVRSPYINFYRGAFR